MRRIVLIALLCMPASAFAAPFSDVPAKHPNAEAISYLQEKGIVEGYEDGTFHPDSIINRAEFVKIIVEALATGPVPRCASDFHSVLASDVRLDDWFAPYVCAAQDARLAEGYPDGTFRPANPINFVESAKILAGAFDTLADFCTGPAPDIDGCPASDERPWYEWYVLSLDYRNRIPSTILRLDQPITRGEMAEMIFRLATDIQDRPATHYSDLRW